MSIWQKIKSVFTSKKADTPVGSSLNSQNSSALEDTQMGPAKTFQASNNEAKKAPTAENKPKACTSGCPIDNSSLSRSNPTGNKRASFTKEDAEKALRVIYEKYGREMAQIIERMYRDETAHFTSGQFKYTGTGGMEEGKWDEGLFEEHPEYKPVGTWSAFENIGSSGLGGNTQVTDKPKVFLVFPSVEAAMIYKAEYIIRYDGNFARWHSTDETTQKFYKEKLLKIRTPIVDLFK